MAFFKLDMAALNSALKVKQFINATKSKNKINLNAYNITYSS